MSKPVKALVRKELAGRLKGADSMVVLSLSGVDGLATNRLRRDFKDKNIRITVVKNSVARQALREVGLERAAALLEGPCALVVGEDPDEGGVVPIVRDLLARRKDVPALSVRGALMEGEVFGPERMGELSTYPTLKGALGIVVALANSPGARLVGGLLGPGGRLAGILKIIEQRAAEPPPAEAAAPA